MGKGIAALTLDADYQKQRREQMAKRPENIGVGLAQGGKGLLFVRVFRGFLILFIWFLYKGIRPRRHWSRY